MNIRQQSFFLAQFMPALLIVTIPWPVLAQEDMDEAAGPAVETPAAPVDVNRQPTGSEVMDQLELDRTEITGNQELPKVLYIVPWRNPDPEELPGPPMGTLLEEQPAPLDREKFTRRAAYFDDLLGKNE